MAIRSISVRTLAKLSGVPYGTLRKIMDLNTVADYEQITKIANALHVPADAIVKDAEALSKDPDVVADWREENGLPTADAAIDEDAALASAVDDSTVLDMSGWSADEQAAYVASHMNQFDVAAKKGDIEREQEAFEEQP